MKIPRQIYVNDGALEIRMPLTPEEIELGRQTKYDIVNNTGIDSRLLASFSIRETESGYEIQRRFNLKGQEPVKVGHTPSLEDAERAAYNYACLLASKLPSRPIPTYDFVQIDRQDLEEKLRREDTQ